MKAASVLIAQLMDCLQKGMGLPWLQWLNGYFFAGCQSWCFELCLGH